MSSYLAERSPIDAIPFIKYSGKDGQGSLRQEKLPNVLDPSLDRLQELETEFLKDGCLTLPDMTVEASGDVVEKILADRRRLINFGKRLTSLVPQDSPESSAALEAYYARTEHDISITNLVVAGINKVWTDFRRHNEYVYGSINEDLDRGVKDWFAHEATEALSDGRLEVEAAAARVLDVVGGENGQRRLFVPRAELFNATRRQSSEPGGYLYQLFEGVDIPSETITEDIGDDLVRHMLRNVGSNTRLKPGRYWAYDAETNELERPKHYELESQDFREYQGHEFLHMIEGIKGRQGPLLLASTGLDHYSLGNEGSAIIPEQIANESFKHFARERRWHMILGRHLAVSLGSGVHGRQQSLSAVELYAVLKDAFFVYEAKREDMISIEDSARRAHKQAWELLCEVQAGTDGSRESGVISWPLPYAGGNVRAWRLEEGSPGSYAREAVGKFDRSNQSHRRIMAMVGVLAI